MKNTCNWEVIDGFVSAGEYLRFCDWIKSQVDSGMAQETGVEDSFAGELFDEKWFICKESTDIWRLVAPQAPFPGYWGPVQ